MDKYVSVVGAKMIGPRIGKYNADGKIFTYDVDDVIKIRTGETGFDALQDYPPKV